MVRKIALILFFITISLVIIKGNIISDEISKNIGTESVVPVSKTEVHSETDSEETVYALIFVMFSLLIGLTLKQLSQKTKLPYTVCLLFFGLLLGVFPRLIVIHNSSEISIVGDIIKWASQIQPHTILFLFLPTLIFEASFNMDLHTFKKSFGNAFLLAVPGLIIALIITAGVCIFLKKSDLGFYSWDWTTALMFGTLISATDPVAVVALLKELGTNKKLTMLVDSESLLNDGTAIVLFMVFLSILTGTASDSSPVVDFVRVSLGGAVIGYILAMIVSKWLGKIINDMLFESTLIIAAAYIVFVINEHFFHVSGIIGTLAFGLYMAGKGKTAISPEVTNFLKEFWELAAFLANTLIFLLVGILIGQKTSFQPANILTLLLFFIGLNIARFVMIFILFPLMKRIGYGITWQNAIVLGWGGGLRGAVGLALSLIVAGNMLIPEPVRQDVLFYTAGIVILSSLINALTAKSIIKKLGLTELSTMKKNMLRNAWQNIYQSALNMLDKLKNDRYMAGAEWKEVAKNILPVAIDEDIKIEHSNIIYEIRKRLLEKERNIYWSLFSEGLLSSNAVMELSNTIDIMLDNEGKISLSQRKDLEELWSVNKFWQRIFKITFLKKLLSQYLSNKLSFGFDCARGFALAQDELLKVLRSVALNIQTDSTDEKINEIIDNLENEIFENRIQALTFMRNTKELYPDIYKSIETKYASRYLLNFQMLRLSKLIDQRQIEEDEAVIILTKLMNKLKEI